MGGNVGEVWNAVLAPRGNYLWRWSVLLRDSVPGVEVAGQI